MKTNKFQTLIIVSKYHTEQIKNHLLYLIYFTTLNVNVCILYYIIDYNIATQLEFIIHISELTRLTKIVPK